MVLASGIRRANLSFARPYAEGCCTELAIGCTHSGTPSAEGWTSSASWGVPTPRWPARSSPSCAGAARFTSSPRRTRPGGRSVMERPEQITIFPLANHRSTRRRHAVRAARPGRLCAHRLFSLGVCGWCGRVRGRHRELRAVHRAEHQRLADGDRPIRAVHASYGTLRANRSRRAPCRRRYRWIRSSTRGTTSFT